MTPAAQRIALSKVHGWKIVPSGAENEWHLLRPSGSIRTAFRTQGRTPTFEDFILDLPDFLNDLNEVREVEGVLMTEQTICYVLTLCDQLELPHAFRHHARSYWILIHASAPQRSEAILRTLGLWDDSK